MDVSNTPLSVMRLDYGESFFLWGAFWISPYLNRSNLVLQVDVQHGRVYDPFQLNNCFSK